MGDHQQNNMLSEKQTNPAKSPRPIIRIVLSLFIIGAGIGAAFYLKNSAPRIKKQPPVKLSPTQGVTVAAWIQTSYQAAYQPCIYDRLGGGTGYA